MAARKRICSSEKDSLKQTSYIGLSYHQLFCLGKRANNNELLLAGKPCSSEDDCPEACWTSAGTCGPFLRCGLVDLGGLVLRPFFDRENVFCGL